MRIQRLIAIWAAKLCSTACRLAGKQGVTLAGKLARKIDPDILRELSLEVREKIFVVCGTNGKTTTNNLLCSAIESEGMKLVCNHTGSRTMDIWTRTMRVLRLTRRLPCVFSRILNRTIWC